MSGLASARLSTTSTYISVVCAAEQRLHGLWHVRFDVRDNGGLSGHAGEAFGRARGGGSAGRIGWESHPRAGVYKYKQVQHRNAYLQVVALEWLRIGGEGGFVPEGPASLKGLGRIGTARTSQIL